MSNLYMILENLKTQPRPLTYAENLYVAQLTEELSQVGSSGARWLILGREGMSPHDGLALFESLILKLAAGAQPRHVEG